MRESVQDWKTHEAAGADTQLLSEALSAWMDGEALPLGVDQDVLLQWLLQDAQAQQKWQCWHASADCLHGGSVADVGHFDAAAGAAVGSAAWSQRLRQELEKVRMGSDHTDRQMPLQDAVAGWVRAAPEAANDSVWHWKMAAGFTSLAALGVMVWSLLGQQPMMGMSQQVNMARNGASVSSPATLSPIQAQVIQAAVLDQEPLDVAVEADPYTETLMLAHAQLGENILLQDVLSME